jgi:ABC-2 type transport system ATP-binding protein
MANRQVLIRAQSLVKRYGRRAVVDGVSLAVNAGEVLAVIGPNGAGKSTTLDLILRLRRPDEGAVDYAEPELRRRIGVQLQTTPVFPGYTALENMRLAAAFHRLRPGDGELLRRLAACGLAEAAKTDAARLSGGQQKRLAIAMALVHDPKLLFLDEPTAALDPRARREVRELIGSLTKGGTSVVFTSHEMEEVHRLADRIVFISAGRILAEGTPASLLEAHNAPDLEQLYLRLTAG